MGEARTKLSWTVSEKILYKGGEQAFEMTIEMAE